MPEKDNYSGYWASLIAGKLKDTGAVVGAVTVTKDGHHITIMDKTGNGIYRLTVTKDS